MGRRIGFGLLAAMLLAGHPLRAQWVVSDPSNLAQGIVNSTKQVVEAAKNGSTMLQSFQEKSGATICKDLKGVETGKVLCPCAQCVRNAVLAAGEMLGE